MIRNSPFDQPFDSRTRKRHALNLNLSGTETVIHSVVIDGTEPGPSLLVSAGIHGAEYPGIETLVRLGASVEPQSLLGRLVLVPIANPSAFRARSAFVTPPDGKNLNRMFPGESDGSFTEQLAYHLLEQYFCRADAYIDLHSGDLVEALHPFSSYALTGNPAQDSRAEALARSFGIETVIRFSAEDHGRLSHVAAALRGVPSLLAEVGGRGLWSEQDVALFTNGIHRVLHALGMNATASFSPQPVQFYNRFDWHFGQVDGLWYPSVSVGDSVVAGQTVGEVRSVYGDRLQTVISEDEGLNVFMLSALSSREGDPLIGIAADPDRES